MKRIGRSTTSSCSRIPHVLVASAATVITIASGCGSGDVGVKVVQPRRGEIRESFREPARTRLSKTWRITMPIAGRIGRIDLEPGDRVTAGQDLAAFDRVPLVELVREAQAAVHELEAALSGYQAAQGKTGHHHRPDRDVTAQLFFYGGTGLPAEAVGALMPDDDLAASWLDAYEALSYDQQAQLNGRLEGVDEVENVLLITADYLRERTGS